MRFFPGFCSSVRRNSFTRPRARQGVAQRCSRTEVSPQSRVDPNLEASMPALQNACTRTEADESALHQRWTRNLFKARWQKYQWEVFDAESLLESRANSPPRKAASFPTSKIARGHDSSGSHPAHERHQLPSFQPWPHTPNDQTFANPIWHQHGKKEKGKWGKPKINDIFGASFRRDVRARNSPTERETRRMESTDRGDSGARTNPRAAWWTDGQDQGQDQRGTREPGEW